MYSQRESVAVPIKKVTKILRDLAGHEGKSNDEGSYGNMHVQSGAYQQTFITQLRRLERHI